MQLSKPGLDWLRVDMFNISDGWANVNAELRTHVSGRYGANIAGVQFEGGTQDPNGAVRVNYTTLAPGSAFDATAFLALVCHALQHLSHLYKQVGASSCLSGQKPP